MRYALIGCGRISPNHIVAAQANKLEIAAICDICESNMEDKILKFGLDSSVKKYTRKYGLKAKKELRQRISRIWNSS